ncbi:glycerophosphoryl diester phosphodiesterase [Novosphingobium chloroacetimidivorans]|uniref:glycerophosphodiester phosphodiesterase n=1 Tax=Novosphingobium chloroacetimidivorans TaxID=1428314 RepID=A0A7W7K8P4_9SPHN|nr:glycerophosphodiester phosphodiesterase [Novosphingobium chloroacetimidivorans]MBB4858302.1 glycerophosphoryl diester phosphodiesterase [Novosphingobium chloroacetimidivorans]
MTADLTRRAVLGAGAGLALASALPLHAAQGGRGAARRPAKPLVMAHRGASALRPEHTLAAYAKAIADGADFIEPDLVATKDGVLVARHENDISGTTDIATRREFAARRTTKTIDGVAVTGWFTEDFTLAELKTLRARERLGAVRPESQGYDGVFQIVTLEEVADFVAAEAAAHGRTIGLIPELKHSTYFAGIGLPLEPRLIAGLSASTYLRRAPVIVQSFEVSNLKALRGKLGSFSNVQLMQLIEDPRNAPYDTIAAGQRRAYVQMLTPAGLAEIASYADWVAPATRVIIPLGPDGKLAAPTGLVAAAHAAGLLVGTWTFRPENRFLAADFRNAAGEDARNAEGSVAEIRRYLAEGLDGFFTDDPALGRTALG